MEESAYKDLILFHWKNPKNFGRLKNPDKTAFLNNSFCGDKVRVDLLVENKKIKDIKFSGSGCVISLATASILSEYVKGKQVKDLKKLDKGFILKLIGLELGATRLKCALLPLETLQKAINQNGKKPKG